MHSARTELKGATAVVIDRVKLLPETSPVDLRHLDDVPPAAADLAGALVAVQRAAISREPSQHVLQFAPFDRPVAGRVTDIECIVVLFQLSHPVDPIPICFQEHPAR